MPKNADGHHVSAPRSAKRKLEQQDATSNSLPSKKARLSTDGVKDEVKRLLPGLRGGSTRRRHKHVVADSDDDDDDDDTAATKLASKDSSATPTRGIAAEPAESQNESESTSSSPKPDGSNNNSTSEPTSSSPKPAKEPESEGISSSEPTSSSPAPAKDDTGGDDSQSRESVSSPPEVNDSGEPTSSSPRPVKNTEVGENSSSSNEPTSSSPKFAEDHTGGDNKKSSEPTSSSPEPAENLTGGHNQQSSEFASDSPNSSDSSTRSTVDMSKPAKETEEPVVDPSDATDPETTTPASSPIEEVGDARTSEQIAMSATRLTEKQDRHISGLVNNSNQCFANAAIQFFDAALDGHNVDLVLGELQSIQPFTDPMLTPEDDFRVSKTTKGKKRESKMTKVRKGILNRIRDLRNSKKMKALSPRKHMRALLHRMRQFKRKGDSDYVTPYVFQQVLAYGDLSAGRKHLDGREQEDSYEYFQTLLDGVKDSPADDASDEESDDKSAIIDSLFTFKSETRTVCKACDHKGEAKSEVNNAHVLHVQKTKSSFTDLLTESAVSELEGLKCPNCEEYTLQRRLEFTEVADNFLLSINRTGINDTKITTPVELPLQPIELCGKKYVLNAVVQHKGRSAKNGHYTALRRRSPEWKTEAESLWFRFDDEQISAVELEKVKDNQGYGQSSMLLFKAQ